MTTATATAANPDVAVVRGGFEAFAKGDMGAFAAKFAPEAIWNHRNPDRLGGIHDGRDALLAFLAESGRLTEGTLRAVPEGIMADGAGRVAVLTRVSGTRADGRTLDDLQILLFAVDGDVIRRVDQYIGDPPAVTDFWA